MSSPQTRRLPWAADQLVGLVFLSHDKWCHFRVECGREFNTPFDPDHSYALTDPQTDELVGILTPTVFVSTEEDVMYRVFLVRPLLEGPDDTVMHEAKSDLLKVSADLDSTNAAADDAIESFQRADRNRLQREH